MALSIKTEEADRLARQLSGLTGETMTQAVTRALQERLDRLQADCRSGKEDLAAALMATAATLRERYDLTPVSKDEWDAAWGED